MHSLGESLVHLQMLGVASTGSAQVLLRWLLGCTRLRFGPYGQGSAWPSLGLDSNGLRALMLLRWRGPSRRGGSCCRGLSWRRSGPRCRRARQVPGGWRLGAGGWDLCCWSWSWRASRRCLRWRAQGDSGRFGGNRVTGASRVDVGHGSIWTTVRYLHRDGDVLGLFDPGRRDNIPGRCRRVGIDAG